MVAREPIIFPEIEAMTLFTVRVNLDKDCVSIQSVSRMFNLNSLFFIIISCLMCSGGRGRDTIGGGKGMNL